MFQKGNPSALQDALHHGTALLAVNLRGSSFRVEHSAILICISKRFHGWPGIFNYSLRLGKIRSMLAFL
jgi:hypothetical protein